MADNVAIYALVEALKESNERIAAAIERLAKAVETREHVVGGGAVLKKPGS